jgi:predicted glycosyltransferase
MSTRVLFYVQHLLGVGHVRRAQILCRAMSEAGFTVTVALGGIPLPQVSFEGARVVQLPPATIADGDFSQLLDEGGVPVDGGWRARRRDTLLALLDTVEPDALLIEMYPFGRRQFRFELDPLLERARLRASKPAIIASVRDILVTGGPPDRADQAADTLRRLFDAVLVHADPAIVRLDATFAAAAKISHLIHYTGYVGEPSSGRKAGQGEVIVSAGGGAVGAPLLFAAAAARPRTALAGATWRFITGPNFPEDDFCKLTQLRGPVTIVERFRTDFRERLAGCMLSISQAGYNTVMNVLVSRARAIVVPFETDGETEQRRRAEILAERGLLTVITADRLTAETLANGISAALAGTSPAAPAVDLSGAKGTVKLVGELVHSARLAHLPQ